MSYQKPTEKTLSQPRNERRDTASGTLSPKRPQGRRKKGGFWKPQYIILGILGILIIGTVAFFGIRRLSAHPSGSAPILVNGSSPIQAGSTPNASGNGPVPVGSNPNGNGPAAAGSGTPIVIGNGPTNGGGTPIANGVINGITTQPDFVTVVKSQVAQGLHLSSDQMQTQLQKGTQIATLAQQQGLSLDQWHTLELSAAQAGIQKLESEGKITQTSGDTQLQNWHNDTANLDSNLQLTLGGCPPPPPGVSGCPTLK